MRVVVSGASGLIGTALIAAMVRDGHQVLRLVRHPARDPTEIAWDPANGILTVAALAGVDAVVHLAGESIASLPWTRAKKSAIRDSRILGTQLLSDGIAGLGRPPRVMVSASAIGYYGNRGDELLDEASLPGRGFLAEIACDWEAATRSAVERGIRVVHLRNGLVLSPRGGVLARLLPVFRWGLGGPIADGRAWWSWIAIDDLVGVIRFAIADSRLEGSVNGVTPAPVTNAEFTRLLGRVLGRPTVFRVPAAALRFALGEMADEVLLVSARVSPRRLAEAGFRFQWPSLEAALRHLLARTT